MTLDYNPILAADSYKLSHPDMYAPNVDGISAHVIARTNGKDMIVPMGFQMWLQSRLMVPVTTAMVDEAEIFAPKHGEPFNREPWDYIVSKYKGYLPLDIWAVPEGTPVPSGHALVSVQCTDPKVKWIVSHIETALQRGFWPATTIASQCRKTKLELAHFYRISGADMGMLEFALHDFGARGVSSHESAEFSGAGQLALFMGSDNMEAIRAVNHYYNSEMAAFSVPASEHSVECSFGGSDEQEQQYLEHMLDTFAKPGSIVSIVIDGFDTYRAAAKLCSSPLKDKIISSGAKVVFRPDSGDMLEVVPSILRMQEEAFGSVTNEKGFRKINNVGVLQGDGVDHMSILSLLGKVMSLGYTADSVVFGSGGALLQKINRDTFKFAMKASAILVDGKWVGISKNPVTDPGKASMSGRVMLFRSKMTGQYITCDIDKPIDEEFEMAMELVYSYGRITYKTTLAEVRERAKI